MRSESSIVEFGEIASGVVSVVGEEIISLRSEAAFSAELMAEY